jgi:nucleotide-binding universal stress UspA family protein
VQEPALVPQTATDATEEPVTGMLEEARTLAAKFGREVTASTRNGPSVGMELAIAADEHSADLLVLGARVRSYSGQPFLGHGIEYLLEHSEHTVMVVIFPATLSGE